MLQPKLLCFQVLLRGLERLQDYLNALVIIFSIVYYRMTGLVGGGTPEQQQQRAIRVQTRSRYFKPGNHHEKGFIMSTHSMFRGGGEVNMQTPPAQQIVTTSYPTTSSTLTYLLSSNNSSARTTTSTSSNNLDQSFASLNSPAPSSTDTQQKNLLLKSLLNASFSTTGNNDQNSDPGGHISNSRILQLLSQVRDFILCFAYNISDVKCIRVI